MVGDTKLEKNSLLYQNISNIDGDRSYINEKMSSIRTMYIIHMLHNTLYVRIFHKLSQPKYYFELDTPKDNTKTI